MNDDTLPSEIRFRPIQPADEPFLSRLYASTRSEEMKLVDWEGEQKKEFLRMQFEAQHKFYLESFRNADFDLILHDDEPIGRLYLDRRKDEIRLIDIALMPEHRNKGLGGRLMKRILDEGQRAGKPVRIHVERFNPALRLYQRMGFVKIEDKDVYILMEWNPPAK